MPDQNAATQKFDEKTDRSIPFYIIAIIGFAAGVALEVYALYYHVSFVDQLLNSGDETWGLQILYFLAFCVTYVFISQQAKNIYQYRLVLLVLIAVLIIASFLFQWFALLYPEQKSFLCALEWLMLGTGICALRTMWELFHTLFFTASTELFISLSFVLGTVFLLCLAYFSSNPIILLSIYSVFVLVSIISGMIVLKTIPAQKEKLITSSKQFSTYITADILASGAQGIVFGYTVYSVASFGPEAIVPVTVSFAIGSIAAFLNAIMKRHHNYDLTLLLDRLLPLAIIFLLFSPLLQEELQIFFTCIILTVFIYAQVRKITLGAVLNNRINLHPITHSTLVPLPYMVGAAIGYLSAITFIHYFGFSGTNLFFITIMYTLAIIIMLYFGALYNLGVHRPNMLAQHDSGSSNTELAIASRDKGLAQDEFASEIETAYQEYPSEETMSESIPDERPVFRKPFQTRCEHIIEDRGLTRREADVFRYLVRGRNAEFISNTLFISLATAKTHIYRIYAKLEVNSQQQLLDVFESTAHSDDAH